MRKTIGVLLISVVLIGAWGVPCGADPAESGSDAAPAEATERRQDGIIKSIEFEGNRKFKDHVLRQRLGFELGDRLDPFLAEGGRLTIAEVYRKIGFAFVEVTLDRDRLSRGNLFYRIEEGPRAQIESIEFVGNEVMKSATLRKVIKTTEKKWLLWPFYYTEETIEEDLELLREFYYDHGYLDYKIEAETEFAADQGAVYVTFTIDEGPVYRIGSIVISGNERFTQDELRAPMEIMEGEVYLRPVADRDVRGLVGLYREIGYVDAEIRQRARFTPEAGENLVTIELEIVEGNQFRIGRIEIAGNEETQDKVVRRVLDEYGFTPGNLYNARMAPKEGGGLLESYAQRAAVAQEVLIRPVDAADGAADRKDVRIDVKEGSTGMIMPGIGVSSDSGVIGRLVYRQRNFDLSDWPDDPGGYLKPWKHWKGAGQSFSITLEPGTEYSQYYVDFVDPYWRDKPVTFNAMGRSWERYRESYDEERGKGYFGFEQRLKGRWRRSFGFRAENVRVDDLDGDAPLEIIDVKGYTMLFGLRLGIGDTAVDNRYMPSKGYAVDADYEQVTGDYDFGVLGGSYVRYFTLHEDVLGRKTVLAAKVKAATIIGDAPPFEKFYAGGTGQYGLRGFEYRGVSTRGLQTNVADPQLKDPIGSDWVFLAGTELTVPVISKNFALLFFVDSGTIDTGSYRLSIGTGLQIMVPQLFGDVPMRIEIATPLLKDDLDETQVFSFSAGGMF
ncbi:MAG: BamA/TamA family outer membrane protein [Phycisphaerales bacterium]|nr:MAG: BamA/TamA family outer membrane protein [Phycisphaerales bacterium]